MRSFLYLMFVLVLVPFTRVKAASVDQEGLDLRETKTKIFILKDRLNPHLRQKDAEGNAIAFKTNSNKETTGMDCIICHLQRPVLNATREAVADKFAANDPTDVNAVCNQCHEGANLHPVNIKPGDLSVPMDMPRSFPLGAAGVAKNRIVCATCHEMHQKYSTHSLLRGMPESVSQQDVDDALYVDRRDFCKGCHGEILVKMSPHKADKKACTFCHSSDPTLASDVRETLARDVVRVCNFCHAKTSAAHYLETNPFADDNLKDEIAGLDLPMIDGKITCVTCHDPHGESDRAHALRENFVLFAAKSNRIKPHWKGVFCESCHLTRPEDDKPLDFKFDGDFNKMCNWCHATKEATADIHPVGMEVGRKETVVVPEEFLLTDNKVTCVTCHEMKYEKLSNSPLQREVPKFLRGGPYRERSSICFKCHIRKKFSALNAHNQIDDEGEMIDDSCIYCHPSRPDEELVGIEKLRFDVPDYSALCVRCHSDQDHPARHFHLVKPPASVKARIEQYEKVWKVFYPLDANGKIFCGTCHNPHESGIIRSTEVRKGADATKRARMPILPVICALFAIQNEARFSFIYISFNIR